MINIDSSSKVKVVQLVKLIHFSHEYMNIYELGMQQYS